MEGAGGKEHCLEVGAVAEGLGSEARTWVQTPYSGLRAFPSQASHLSTYDHVPWLQAQRRSPAGFTAEEYVGTISPDRWKTHVRMGRRAGWAAQRREFPNTGRSL